MTASTAVPAPPEQEESPDVHVERRPAQGLGDRASGSLLAVSVAVGSLCALVASRPLKDNSLLTHLATGRLILAEGVPAENPFLYTGTDFPVPSWWWSVLLAVAEELAGSTGIRLLTAAVAAAFGVALVRIGARAGARDGVPSLAATLVPALLALVCAFGFLNGRPHLAGFLLLALTVLVLTERRSPWWLVAVFAVWVNVHGSWLYGLAVLGALVVARTVDDRRVRPRELWGVLAAFGGAVLGGALYPRAFEILLLPTRQFGDPVEREALGTYQEWTRVPFDEPMFWVLTTLGLLALWGCVRQRRWASAALVAGLVVMGLSGLRLVPIAAVSLVPFAASALRDVGALGLPAGRVARALVALGVVLGLATVVHSASAPGYVLGPYPVDAVDWLEERDLVARPGVHLVSHDFVGNYLEWRYGADANAYVDDRPDARTLLEYRSLKRLLPDWQDALERSRADVVLWSDERLIDALDAHDGWVRARGFDDFVVFCSDSVAARCS